MCPVCKSDQVSRSKQRRFADVFMRLWGMQPYRCRECQSRFYLPSQLDSKIAADRAWLHDVEEGERSPHTSHSDRRH